MSGTAVIEYQLKAYHPPDLDDDAWTWNIEAQITHAAGVVITQGLKFLAEIRTELEEAGLRLAGEAKPCKKYSDGRFLPTWREVWRTPERAQSQLSPRAAKARQQSASRTRLYQSRQKEEQMKDDAKLLELASKAGKRFPELRGRPIKAAELVRAGKVKRISTTTFRVQSQTSEELYTVDIHKRTCTCPDHLGTFRHSAPEVNGAPMCKHRLACLMKIKVGQKATDAGDIHRQEKQFAASLKAGLIV